MKQTDVPHVVCFDAYNFIHRSRSGFTKGDWSVVFNFFRSFRAEVERHRPTRVIFVTEGSPRRQIAESNGTYKANRKAPDSSFVNQRNTIIKLLSENFPVSVMRHDEFEADDVIYNVVKRSSSSIPWTLISTDTDFIQMLSEFNNLTLYNPVKKQNVDAPGYDYVAWKALRGDATDNISGVPGIGDKTATKLVQDPELFDKKIASDQSKLDTWNRNKRMIRLAEFSPDVLNEVTSTSPTKNWDLVLDTFDKMGFKSMTNEKSWSRFTNTFDHLW